MIERNHHDTSAQHQTRHMETAVSHAEHDHHEHVSDSHGQEDQHHVGHEMHGGHA